uniref:tyrosine-type recombinase/integrase n=1 Tax=Paractinoplanes polyasparticus TaxID=2856853 RepID=UPI001C85056E|nr:tyrosine-type recombinase/integrase [Actinoplanes polyasparticus]
MLDEELRAVPVADAFLLDLRFGRDRAESTTKSYAGAVALFLRWCGETGRDWRSAAADMGLFITWLRYTPADGGSVLIGPGAKPVRGDRRVNVVLVAVRAFLAFAVARKEAPPHVLGQLYELADSADLPREAQLEDGGLHYRLRPRHRMRVPDTDIDRASDEELVALIGACRSARDRLIVLLLSRVGLRRGEAAGLRRSDLHLLPDNRSLGCRVAGAHLHVVPRVNSNGAQAKSRYTRAVPVDFLVVQAIDQYVVERYACREAAACDFLLVNLFRVPLGSPVTPGALNELFEVLCGRANLSRRITPHMCRHAFASNLADSGALLDEIQRLLGHINPASSQPYLHPSAARLRAAVDRVPSPRLPHAGGAR